MINKSIIEITETEKEVLRIINSRHQIGRDRYGCGIEYTQQSDPICWINEAIEEAADMLQYLVALKILLEKKNE